MSERKVPDPISLRQVEGPDRAFYEEGVMLDADDFRTEQNYHRARLARGFKYLFGMGTIAGLDVSIQGVPASDEEEVRVEPGLALDAHGRLIEVPRPACMRIHRWWLAQVAEPDGSPNEAGRSELRSGWRAAAGGRPSGVSVDVFLRFAECERALTPALSQGPFDATDGVQPHRIRDGYQLFVAVQAVRAAPNDLPVPADPWTVRAGILAGANPGQVLHDAALKDWREGTAHWTAQAPKPRMEHPIGVDPTSVLLARLLIPADAAPDVESAPVRREADAIGPDASVRRRVAAPGIFTRWPEGA